LNFLQEDLENSLEKASGQLNRIKSSTGQGDIEVQISIAPLKARLFRFSRFTHDQYFQVAALEDVIKEMKVSVMLLLKMEYKGNRFIQLIVYIPFFAGVFPSISILFLCKEFIFKLKLTIK
jgi:Ni,Fe-hydrogenase III component G